MFYTHEYIKRFREPVNKTDWREHSFPAVVNAFYDTMENSIGKFNKMFTFLSITNTDTSLASNFTENNISIKKSLISIDIIYNFLNKCIHCIATEFPAGILQGVFFSKDRPQYANYGAIGSIIGHEITHGFDDEGRQYDADGNLIDWWEPETHEAFKRKAQCIIDQYANFSDPELNMTVSSKHQSSSISKCKSFLVHS